MHVTGTISKSELEREAGGKIFSSTSTETRNQVTNTRYQGGQGGAAGGAAGSEDSYSSQGSYGARGG